MKYWDYPKIGKIILLGMILIELSTYVYLVINNQQSQKALSLSSYLIFTSLITFIASALTIPLKFYFYHWILFFSIHGIAIISRMVGIVWIIILDNQVSDELYLTVEGYASLMRTSLIFLILLLILVYQKCRYYRTRKEAAEVNLQKLVLI